MTTDPYETGYLVAFAEISQGIASFTRAQQRNIYEGDSNSRMEWDQGYDDCVCAYRLGHDVADMSGKWTMSATRGRKSRERPHTDTRTSATTKARASPRQGDPGLLTHHA